VRFFADTELKIRIFMIEGGLRCIDHSGMETRGSHSPLFVLVLSLFLREDSAMGQTVDSPWHARCGQIVAVVAKTWESPTGGMICLRRGQHGWEVHQDWASVTIGKAGLGLGLGLHPSSLKGPEKREGDKKAPAGIFPLEFAFGTKEFSPAAFPYRRTTRNDFWVDDARSRFYNQWVRMTEPGIKPDWNSAETLRRADGIYDYAIVVGHNRLRVIPGHGSAIFIHAWYGPGVPTIGCTAMEKSRVKSLVEWLDIDRHPVLIQGPEELIPVLELPDEVRTLLGGG